MVNVVAKHSKMIHQLQLLLVLAVMFQRQAHYLQAITISHDGLYLKQVDQLVLDVCQIAVKLMTQGQHLEARFIQRIVLVRNAISVQALVGRLASLVPSPIRCKVVSA